MKRTRFGIPLLLTALAFPWGTMAGATCYKCELVGGQYECEPEDHGSTGLDTCTERHSNGSVLCSISGSVCTGCVETEGNPCNEGDNRDVRYQFVPNGEPSKAFLAYGVKPAATPDTVSRCATST